MLCRFLILIAVLVSGLSAQTSLQVPSASYPTIQSALNAATTGDTVVVAAGTFQENLIWPNAEIVLEGAGPGQSILDGGQAGSCVTFTQGGTGSVVAGFTITNGSGRFIPQTSTLMVAAGGAFHINPGQGAGILSPTIRHCEIINNTATLGGAIFLRYGAVTIEDCDFRSNTVIPAFPPTAAGSVPFGSGIFLQTVGGAVVTLDRCRFSQHSHNVIETGASSGEITFLMNDCDFHHNIGKSVMRVGAANFRIDSSSFTSNVSTDDTVWLGSTATSPINYFDLRSCLFADNTALCVLLANSAIQSSNFQNISNLTITGNVTTSEPVSLFGDGLVSDCIIQGNNDANGQAFTPPIVHPSNNWVFTYNFQNSNIEGMAGQGLGVIDVAPQFVDSQDADYRLAPGSPMIDARTLVPSYPLSAGDVRGWARVKGGAIDLGAYESQSMAHHPDAAGQVGAGLGGPYEILTVNGSTGGPLRTITLPLGTASSMEMAQPPHLSGPLKFAVFGFLDEANLDSVISVPLGIGNMMFAPSPMVPPFFQSIFFTFTDNYSPTNPQLFPSTPTPWNSGPGPSVPFPLTLTFQGVIEEGPGFFRPTNAIVYKIQ